MTDFAIIGDGPMTTVYLLVPQTDSAREWVSENIPEDAQWFGKGIAVEHRYIDGIANGILEAGLTLTATS